MTNRLNNAPRESLRMSICWDVLEGAKDAGDQLVINACRRIIAANRIGRDKELTADWAIVKAFAE